MRTQVAHICMHTSVSNVCMHTQVAHVHMHTQAEVSYERIRIYEESLKSYDSVYMCVNENNIRIRMDSNIHTYTCGTYMELDTHWLCERCNYVCVFMCMYVFNKQAHTRIIIFRHTYMHTSLHVMLHVHIHAS
jgi:hypothetical protein